MTVMNELCSFKIGYTKNYDTYLSSGVGKFRGISRLHCSAMDFPWTMRVLHVIRDGKYILKYFRNTGLLKELETYCQLSLACIYCLRLQRSETYSYTEGGMVAENLRHVKQTGTALQFLIHHQIHIAKCYHLT